jgi:hypothetical protein
MKLISLVISICFCFVLFSCNNSGKPEKVSAVLKNDSLDKQRFFPVTSYLKGEIANIKKAGINPLKYTTTNAQTDSVWVKLENLDSEVQEFLHPDIDSANLIRLYTEESFLDQSINTITFTYNPVALLPDSMKLIHWDVYVDPETNTIKRVYLVKQIDKNKTMQLTWVSNEWCKKTIISTDEKGESKVESEVKLVWDF